VENKQIVKIKLDKPILDNLTIQVNSPGAAVNEIKQRVEEALVELLNRAGNFI
jgi:hypothetical protein